VLVKQCITGLGKLFYCIFVHLPNEEVLLMDGLPPGAEAMDVSACSLVDGNFRLLHILRLSLLLKLSKEKSEYPTFFYLSYSELTDLFYSFPEEIMGIKDCGCDHDDFTMLAEADGETKRDEIDDTIGCQSKKACEIFMIVV
jgi:hypothetical protein